jgi:hypothetical protein
LSTSDVLPGTVNVLTGHHWELAGVMAAHMDIDALDVTGVADDAREEIEAAVANNVKRVVRANQPSPYEVTAFMEMKTVWHPKGA